MKSKNGMIAIICIVAVLLQLMIAPNITILGVRPNFLLVVTFMIAIVNGPTTGAVVGFILGLTFDLLSTGPVGPMALIGTVMGFLVGTLQSNLSSDGWTTPLLLFALAGFLSELMYAILLVVLGTGVAFGTAFLYIVIPATLYNTAVALALFPILNRLLRRKSSSIMTVRKRF